MLKLFPAVLFSAFFLFAAAPVFAADEDGVIGTVLEVQGTATVKSDGQKFPAKLNTRIHVKDVIETGEKSRLFILFIDDTQLTLGEKAHLVVNNYVFDEKKKDNSASYSILDGAFNYVSGLMTKQPDPNAHINTRYGNIGIRGTWLTGGNLGNLFALFLHHGGIDFVTGGGTAGLDGGEGTSTDGIGPGNPEHWTQEQIKELMDLVALKNWDEVLKRIKAHKGDNKDLRLKFIEFLKKHHHHFNYRLRDLPMDDWTGPPPFIPFGGENRGCCIIDGGGDGGGL